MVVSFLGRFVELKVGTNMLRVVLFVCLVYFWVQGLVGPSGGRDLDKQLGNTIQLL